MAFWPFLRWSYASCPPARRCQRKRGNPLVSMTTGLPVRLEPENNPQPTMVGVFVDGSVRRQGIADKVLESSWSSKSLVGRGAWVDSPRCVDHLRQRPCNSGLSSMPFPVHRHNQTERPYASGPEMGDSAGVSEPHSRCVKRADARGIPHAPTYERTTPVGLEKEREVIDEEIAAYVNQKIQFCVEALSALVERFTVRRQILPVKPSRFRLMRFCSKSLRWRLRTAADKDVRDTCLLPCRPREISLCRLS